MFDSDFGHVIAAQKKFRFWETVSKAFSYVLTHFNGSQLKNPDISGATH